MDDYPVILPGNYAAIDERKMIKPVKMNRFGKTSHGIDSDKDINSRKKLFLGQLDLS